MNRCVLSLAVVLGGVGFLSANYVIIVANLGESTEPPAGTQPGAPGGLPPIGVQPRPGGANPGGLVKGARPVAAPEGDPEAVPLYVVAVVEVTLPTGGQFTLKQFDGGQFGNFKHRWGSSLLQEKSGNSKVAVVKMDGKNLPSVSKRFAAKYDLLKASRKDGGYTPDQFVEIAEWALSHGLMSAKDDPKDNRFFQVMEKMAENYPDHPLASAYKRTKTDLARSLPAYGGGAELKKKLLDGFQTSDSAHYTLIHDMSGASATDVKARLDRLEEAFRNVYFWFALRGRTLPLPKEKLVVVLTGNDKEYDRLYEILTAGQGIAEVGVRSDDAVAGTPAARSSRPVVVSDSFLGRRHNVVVQSSKRLDDQFDALDKSTMSVWQQGFSRQDIFKGLAYLKQKKLLPEKTEEADVAKAMTAGLLLKQMEYDAEVAGTSHACTRQILYAAGLVPRNVAVPEWAEFGVGSFFETTPGSPWPTNGSVNYEYLSTFKAIKKHRRFEATPLKTLQTVVSDGYFRRLTTAKDRPVALRKARAASWSLTIFLAQKKMDHLLTYFKELGKMPRDLELSDEALLNCFARAFDCVDAAKKVDEKKLTTLANQWYRFIDDTQIEPELLAVYEQVQSTLRGGGKDKVAPKGGVGAALPGGVGAAQR